MGKIRTVNDIDLKEKRVLIRVDYNVPMENGKITDDTRIAKSLDTLQVCLKANAKIILMSHMGRPKGKVDAEFSLKPIAEHLSKLIGKPVKMLSDCVGAEVKKSVENMKGGEIVMLENLRFHAEETDNNADFSKELASLADVYVNDAFGAAHRAHASTVGVTDYVQDCVGGLLLKKEIDYLGKAITNPDRPFVTILGGAKVSDKIKLISNLMDKADTILIGGAMAYTFYKVMGIGIGTSKFEPEGVPAAEECLKKAKEKNFPLVFPCDRLIAPSFDRASENVITEDAIPDDWSGFDIGPKTIAQFIEILKEAKTVVWNGPVGLFEVDEFSQGTRQIAKALSEMKSTRIIGGGDTAAAVKKYGLDDKMSHVSTGGGASLEFLEGKVLPGVAALQSKSTIA